METRASYVLVGAFVLGLVGAALFFVLWLGTTGAPDKASYHVILTGNVTGLAKGTSVRYRGIHKGEVGEIRLRAPTDYERATFEKLQDEVIDVEIKVASDTPVYSDTVASIESQGLTGSPFIQLRRKYTAGATKLDAKDKVRNVIPGESAGFDAALEQLQSALKSVTALSEQATKLLDAENQKEFKNILTGATKALASIEDLAKEAKSTVDELKKPIATLDGVGKEGQETLKSFKTAAVEIRGLMADARTMLRENRRPLADFAATGLYEFSLFLTDMRKFVRTFDRLLVRLESDPSQFLFGNRQRGFETQGNR
jgi:phospholipid/cholesterol/gamma-HCH transport system substrate-binding protein